MGIISVADWTEQLWTAESARALTPELAASVTLTGVVWGGWCCCQTNSSGYGRGYDDDQRCHNSQHMFFHSGQEQTQGQLLPATRSAASITTKPE